MAAAIMEQRRLGLIAKAMLVVPGHCLAQAAREFLALMSAQHIQDLAPLGAIIHYADGMARPPAHHRRKLEFWENTNNAGQLIRKQPGGHRGIEGFSATFTLHKGDLGQGGIILVRVHETFDIRSRLTFTIIERPRIGSVRVLSGEGDDRELLHLADDLTAAERWRELSGYRQAVLDPVTADEHAADVVEGRAVA
ncbi:hypothetical protein C8J36_11118 [Rhizobium sp. PP-F2F-G48]|nr:hypothetical protein [Rhizobium sp. PP-F2F-G48]TCM50686.1 hypothetical protein C8J36_11118 [Rhizobium sp. PP-F2F-G48]